MEWPEVIQFQHIQSTLILDGVPLERAQKYVSEIRQLQAGGKYHIERAGSPDLYLYVRGDGWFYVRNE
jgi:hypothetical protein